MCNVIPDIVEHKELSTDEYLEGCVDDPISCKAEVLGQA